MRERHGKVAVLAIVLMLSAAVLLAGPAGAGAVLVPGTVNVLEDCWTTSLALDSDPERELYSFTTFDAIDFVWKHKILEPCSNYVALIAIFDCKDGKPRLFRDSPVRRHFPIRIGDLVPDPGVPEPLFTHTVPPGALAPGRYDWALITECNDTNNRAANDADVDDECGINMGRISTPGPVILGPEPIELWQPDPGGSPPGRGPGEEGTTRPWCFEVTESAACEPQMCGTYTNCNPDPRGIFCACVAVAEGGGVCSSGGSCSTPCPNGTSDCSAGQVCVLNSCCAGPVCLSRTCSGTAASSALSGPTAFGSSR